MGFPRYVRNKFESDWRECPPETMVQIGFRAATDNCEKIRRLKAIVKAAALRPAHFERCLSAAFWKHTWYSIRYPMVAAVQRDSLERIPAEMYVGLLPTVGDRVIPEYRQVMVPRYFAASLQKRNEARVAEDLRHAALVAEIAAIKSKRYKSRGFPGTLRSLIFERDGYRCCNCGKHREELVKLGLQLEVDHIVAVVDGGFTEYSNGETLCSECNIAKHHNKHFYALMRQVRRPSAAACAA